MDRPPSVREPKRRLWFALLTLVLGATLALVFVVSKPRTEVAVLCERFPELTLVGHAREDENEAWLFTGEARADDVARRVQRLLAKRPGWITPNAAFGTIFAYGNHYSPIVAPRWFDRFAVLRIPDRRPVLDVHVMVGRAVPNGEERPHGSDWTTVQILATSFRDAVSGTGTNPLDGWTVYR